MYPLFALGALSPAVVLTGLGIGAAAAVIGLIIIVMRNQNSSGNTVSFLTHLQGYEKSPEMQLIGKALASRLKDFGDATGHALFNSLLTHFLPGTTPFVPAIDKGLSAVEGRLAGSQPAPQPPQPSSGTKATSPQAIHLEFPAATHPVGQLFADFLAAALKHQQAAVSK